MNMEKSATFAGLSEAQIVTLNERYAALDFSERLHQLYEDFAPEKVMVTSSFAATSAYFLHIVSTIRPEQIIHFIDTGYHFPETIEYRKYLIDLFKLNVEDIRAEDWKHQFTQTEQTYLKDPDLPIFEIRRGMIKFNPMIDVSREARDAYIREHDLPFHPLVAKGYSSIGCTHCTVQGEGRSGRWLGKPKTECGLHL